MAGLFTALRLKRNSISSSSSSFVQSSRDTCASRLLLLITLLSVSLAFFAFVLQWRGRLPDPDTRFSFPGGGITGMGVYRPVISSPFSSGLDGILGRSRTPSFPYFRDWKIKPGLYSGSGPLPKICITTTTSAGLEQTLPWILFHKVVGVTNFFMFVEGKAASTFSTRVLESIPGVSVINRTRELVELQAKSRIFNDTSLREFFYKPCNNELFARQSLNMEMGIVMAREVGMDWIFHLDTDELIHPAGSHEYSVQELLSEIPPEVDNVVFPNFEASVESDNVKEPFSEVSLFKKNQDHISREAYFEYYRVACRGNPNYFLTYGNGKSAARIQDHLRPNGAHRWHNYKKIPKEVQFNEAVVLHYSYCKLSDLTSRRDRCNCKPTKEGVERCFMLPFDRNAYIIASSSTEEEMRQWYKEHVVWDNENLKHKLMVGGMFTRIYSPMIIIKHMRESGVFSSIIAEAMANKYNASRHERLWKTYSKKFSRTFESKATDEKIYNVKKPEYRIVLPESPPTDGSY